MVEPEVVERVIAVLTECGLAPGRLVLEVTESVVMTDDEGSVAALRALHGHGVQIAIDDFGTGYSSLSRLRSLDVSKLKIDKSFIDNVTHGARDPLVAAIIAMGHGVGLTVVAEGVETEAQARALAALGCDSAQGYLFSRPLPLDELTEQLRAGALPTSPAGVTAAALPWEADLMRAVAEAARQPDLEAMVRPLLAVLRTTTGLESAYLAPIDWDRGVQEITYADNGGALEFGEGDSFPWEETMCRLALAGRPAVTTDVPRHYGDVPAASELQLQTWASAPVVSGDGQVVATLCGASTRRVALPDHTRELIDLFARLVADRMGGQRPRPNVAAADAIRVVVVDDDDLTRTLIRRLLSGRGAADFEVVAEAANGVDGVRAAARSQPDVVLLDIDIPELDSAVVVPFIRAACPYARIVIVSARRDAALLVEGLGVDAVITKQSLPSTFVPLLLDLFSPDRARVTA